MRHPVVLLLLAALAISAQAEIQTKAVDYEDDGTRLTGHLYWDDAKESKRPGILVIHEWWGLNDYAKKRAGMLAEQGYVAFAADMYGTGRVTDKPEQAKEWMQEVTVDPELWRQRGPTGARPAACQRPGGDRQGRGHRLLLRRRNRPADGLR